MGKFIIYHPIFIRNESVVSTIFDLDEDVSNTPEVRLIGMELEEKDLIEPILMEGDYIVREVTLKNGGTIKSAICKL
ncbi:hypothetical protein DS745_06335 [Anaerobacillus alkaliphilus]|uniref:Uncharacterized protein n=1 Tax=Anaerobacillus alkaliphilus TaxID=1548597 RepID=A0A4Q0VWK4_9BACI|nr:hypothetical protein DS745_06335 [Anaerobacillus alkaliphilus]